MKFAAAQAEDAGDDRPLLDVTNSALLSDGLVEMLGTGPLSGLFMRSGDVVRVPRVGEDGYIPPPPEKAKKGWDDGPAQIRKMRPRVLQALLRRKYRTGRVVRKYGEWRDELAPLDACEIPLNVPEDCPNLRTIVGVTHVPVLRDTGTILDEPGYDSDSGLLFLPEVGVRFWSIPAYPTAANIRKARQTLLRPIEQFPFVTDHDRANFLTLMLTPAVRPLLPPPYPLFIVNAHQPGSGKTYLCNIPRFMYGGVFRPEPATDGMEVRKQIYSDLLTTTGAVIVWDNVNGVIRHPAISALLTSPVYSDRTLGAHHTGILANDRLWVANGNNVPLGGDLPRRGLWANIDPGVPHPERRTGFAIPDLMGYVEANRTRLVAAALVLARAWVVEGQPGEATRSDSYTEWVAGMQGILDVAGVPGTVWHAETIQAEVGADDEDWAGFLAALEQQYRGSWFTVADFVRDSSEPTVDGTTLLDAAPDELAELIGRGRSKSAGWWFRNRNGRWAGDLRLIAESGEGSRRARYRVQRSRPSE
jgi:hypothetical protein